MSGEIEAYLGIDIGSATVKVVGIDREGQMVGTPVYTRHDQFPSQVDALKHAFSQYLASGQLKVVGIGTTGSGRELNKKIIGADLVRTEIFAHAVGVNHLVKSGQVWVGQDGQQVQVDRVGTVLEIGGQDSKVIIFGEGGIPAFFNMNTICSAGTGEFLKQLADDADIDIREFGSNALRATTPARIDATCTVFSKRDFRHLTQKGVPLEDRLMGACQAMVNNYLLNVVQDAELCAPVFFQGGVAFNQAVRRAFEARLGTPVYVTPHNDVVGALGMAVIVRDTMLGQPGLATSFKDDFFQRRYDSRVRYCHGCQNACDLAQPFEEHQGQILVLETLGGRCEGSQNPKNVKEMPQALKTFSVPVTRQSRQRPAFNIMNPDGLAGRDSAGRYFAGIDGGSRSTKYAVIRSLGHTPAAKNGSNPRDLEIIIAGAVDTAGDAMGACLRALEKVRDALPAGMQLDGIGTAGSAGELCRDMITSQDRNTSDFRATEIVAHYAWASYWVPNVGTVIDIGGNDAKIIAVKDSGLDFAMNDKCAAGTGSFLESVARRFQVPIEQYADVALTSHDPARIAGRCAVFGESDIIHKSRLGFATRDLFLGLAYSICRTYLSDVGRGKPLRVPLVAQGGTFLNQAVQHAFREVLGLGQDEFIVAEDKRYVLCAGALGAALMARSKWEQGLDTAFKGFDRVLSSAYRTVTLDCHYAPCPRRCTGVVALLENGQPVAGYKAIDCDYGLFSGLFTEPYQQEHVVSLLESLARGEPLAAGQVALG
ncbi:MAG: hypothetical protein HY335_00970 [Deinococcus sp.]|nr:hypothetical protein [Deinococcus sp.]